MFCYSMLPGMPLSAKKLIVMFSIVLGLGIICGLAFHAWTSQSLALPSVNDWLSAPDSDTSVRTDRAFFEESYPFESDHSDTTTEIAKGDEYNSNTVNDTLAISMAIPKPNKGDTIQSVATLENELSALQLEDYYHANVSDCSELSAFVEWWLEGHGIHAYIVEGSIAAHPEIAVGNFVYEADDGGPHVWVATELEGDSILIECTGVYLVPDALQPYYREEERFEDVQALVMWYHEEGYDFQSVLREYDWWEVLPAEFIYGR
jgi:hypothetical protein